MNNVGRVLLIRHTPCNPRYFKNPTNFYLDFKTSLPIFVTWETLIMHLKDAKQCPSIMEDHLLLTMQALFSPCNYLLSNIRTQEFSAM